MKRPTNPAVEAPARMLFAAALVLVADAAVPVAVPEPKQNKTLVILDGYQGPLEQAAHQ